MRTWLWFAVALATAACEDPAPCGVDVEENPYPVCTVELVDKVTIDYCPGDQWGAVDGCNSCGCSEDGEVVCTSVTCPAGG